MLRRLALLTLLVILAAAGSYWWVAIRSLPLPQPEFSFSVKPGATLRSVAHELTRNGLLAADWTLVLLGRAASAGTTLAGLLRKLTQGDVTQSSFTIVEGWNFRDLQVALKANPNIVVSVSDLPPSELMHRIGAAESEPEGWFLPETYYFANGSTDAALLKRAYHLMHERLDAAWNARAAELPLNTPYEALTLASIVEKETGRPADRPLVAAVFINRLRHGMRLQTDPTVIYGLGTGFDGTLRRRDLDSDHAFNTYTRDGLPPTPIALPSQASLDAVLHPPASPYLYFVARGDGSSEFSTNLSDHNRAVAKYQRGGR
jgi:UPF0755 protein